MNCYTIDDSGEVQELFGIPFRKMIEEWLGFFTPSLGLKTIGKMAEALLIELYPVRFNAVYCVIWQSSCN